MVYFLQPFAYLCIWRNFCSMVGNIPRAVISKSMSVSVATFEDSAHPATVSSTAASTLSSADKGGGVKTGENEGEFMAMNEIVSSSTLLTDYVLVRTELLPHLGEYQLLSFKERFRRIPVEGIRPYLAVSAFFKFWRSFINAKAEEMLEWGSIVEKDIFLPPTLAFILRRTFLEDRGVRSWKTIPNILV